jgi:hypothetical protein
MKVENIIEDKLSRRHLIKSAGKLVVKRTEYVVKCGSGKEDVCNASLAL